MNAFILSNYLQNKPSKSHSIIYFLKFLVFLFFISFLSFQNANGNGIVLDGKSYQTENDNSYKNMTNVEGKMSYGPANIGPVKLYKPSGKINKNEINNIDAYASDNTVMIKIQC